MTQMSAPSLWDFAVDVYERPGVADAALALQDEMAFSVPMLFWILWMARYFETPSEAVLRKGMEESERRASWGAPALRATRRAIDSAVRGGERAAAPLYEAVKAAELLAERLEIDALDAIARAQLADAAPLSAPSSATLSASSADASARARRALARYSALTGAPARPGFSTDALHRLVDAIGDPTTDEAPA